MLSFVRNMFQSRVLYSCHVLHNNQADLRDMRTFLRELYYKNHIVTIRCAYVTGTSCLKRRNVDVASWPNWKIVNAVQ